MALGCASAHALLIEELLSGCFPWPLADGDYEEAVFFFFNIKKRRCLDNTIEFPTLQVGCILLSIFRDKGMMFPRLMTTRFPILLPDGFCSYCRPRLYSLLHD